MPSANLIAAFMVLLALLSGCQTLPQSESLSRNPPSDLSANKKILDVPFIAQEAYFCGPTTLAEVFQYYGQAISPDEVAPKLFIPEREGSLQLEMISATRQFGFLPYTDKGNMQNIVRLIDDGIPVIVFQNLAISWFPMWHYAVVTGYDLDTQEFILHSGVTREHRMPYRLFERTWQRGGYWMLAALPPGSASQELDPFIYISAAHDLLSLGMEKPALMSLESATYAWKEVWLSYFLLANHYLNADPKTAAYWFSLGFSAGSSQIEYLNNYGYALAKIGCSDKAQQILSNAIAIEPQNALLAETLDDIRSMSKTKSSEKYRQCDIYHY